MAKNDCIFTDDWKKVKVNTLKRNDSAIAFLYALEVFKNKEIGENKMEFETILCQETIHELFNRGFITYNQYCMLCEEIRKQKEELKKQSKIKEIESKIEALKNEVENIKRSV